MLWQWHSRRGGLRGLLGIYSAFAACAPADFEEASAPRCILHQCRPGGEKRCASGQERWRLDFDQALVSWEAATSRMAALPWERVEPEPACRGDRDCPASARCLRGDCWRSPRSRSELKRWFRGEEPLSGALSGWQLQPLGPSSLEVTAAQAPVLGQVVGIYAGARWVNSQGHPLGASLQPLQWIALSRSWPAQDPRALVETTQPVYSLLGGCDTQSSVPQP